GPSATTGKYVSPTTITTTPVSSAANRPVFVGNVPADGGVGCLRPSEPAIASTGIISMNRPTSIESAPGRLYQLVSPVRPANAEPLLFACDVNAYVTSVRPCGPGFAIELSAQCVTIEIPVNSRTTSGTNKM